MILRVRLKHDFCIIRTVLFKICTVLYGVSPNLYNFVQLYTLRHVTTKFAHMNGHWKAYNFLFDFIG